MIPALLLSLALVQEDLSALEAQYRTPPSPTPPENVEEIREWTEDRLADFYLNVFKRYGVNLGRFGREICDIDEDPSQRCFYGDVDALPCPGKYWSCRPHKDASHFFLGLQNALQSAALRVPDDGFVVGQAVNALVKGGRYPQALEVAESCEAALWRCEALMGHLHYKLDRREQATRHLLAAFAAAPDSVKCAWRDIHPLLSEGDDRDRYLDMSCEDRREVEDRAWWLADPLWLAAGNDRRAQHLARRIEIDLHREIWELKDYLPPLFASGPGGPPDPYAEDPLPGILEDRVDAGGSDDYPVIDGHRAHHDLDVVLGGHDRGVVAIGFPDSWAHDPGTRSRSRYDHYRMWVSERKSRYRFFPESEYLDDPTAIPLDHWDFEPGEGFERYTPDYGLFTSDLDHRTAWFLRGDSAVVALALDLGEHEAFIGLPRNVGLFFQQAEDHDPVSLFTQRSQESYVFRAPVEDAPHVMSLEVVAPDQIGRARYGVRGPWTEERAEGRRVVLSDILLFEPVGMSLPETVDEAIPLMRASPVWAFGSEVGLFWEVYGLEPGESARVSVRIGEVATGFFSRLGRALSLSGENALTVDWEDAAEDAEDELLARSFTIDLDNIDSGEHEIVVTVQVQGQPAASRTVRIVVEEEPEDGG